MVTRLPVIHRLELRWLMSDMPSLRKGGRSCRQQWRKLNIQLRSYSSMGYCRWRNWFTDGCGIW